MHLFFNASLNLFQTSRPFNVLDLMIECEYLRSKSIEDFVPSMPYTHPMFGCYASVCFIFLLFSPLSPILQTVLFGYIIIKKYYLTAACDMTKMPFHIIMKFGELAQNVKHQFRANICDEE